MQVIERYMTIGGVVYFKRKDNSMCEHYPSPVVGYNWKTDTFYCNVCNEEFKIEEDEEESS